MVLFVDISQHERGIKRGIPGAEQKKNGRMPLTGCLEQDSKILAQRKEYKIIQNEAEDAGRLTPVKDDNEVVEDLAP